ncbi:hypothetical protein LJC42_05225 [Eubacteriales bacterium OttesenSCG-928-K08]|nr:hypothetical protein [Eubacteriales bacterium OttesenSCG-928-K08]
MLEVLYSFAMHIAAMAVLCVLAEFLIPRGKIKSTVQLCVGIIFVLSIAGYLTGSMQGEAWLFDADVSKQMEQLPPASEAFNHEELIKDYYRKSLEIANE